MIHQPYANHAQTHTANVEKHTASSQKKDWKYTKMTRKQCAKHTHTHKSHAADSLKRQWKIQKNDTQTIRKTYTQTRCRNTHAQQVH